MSATKDAPRRSKPVDRRPFCSACGSRVDGEPLTFDARQGSRMTNVGAYCGSRCLTIGRAIYALADTPLGEPLAAAWRRGRGPDPAIVLAAVERRAT